MRDAQKDVDLIAAIRDEFLKNKPPSVPYRDTDENLIDEAPLFSDDPEFNSTDHILTAHFDDPPTFKYTSQKLQLVVAVSLPQGATLEDPQSVQNALSKLYKRVKYYSSIS